MGQKALRKQSIDSSLGLGSSRDLSIYDVAIQQYYKSKIDNLTSLELDRKFTEDLQILTKSLSKISVENRKAFIDIFSKLLEVYIENKVEKEIEYSLNKIIGFNG